MNNNDKFSEGIVKGYMGAVIILFSNIFHPIIQGWVAQKIWGWFITPQFHINSPRIVILIGISCILGVLHQQQIIYNQKDEETFSGSMAKLIVATLFPFLILLTAWVAHFFV